MAESSTNDAGETEDLSCYLFLYRNRTESLSLTLYKQQFKVNQRL